jgi:hypothetical protein
MKQRRRPPRDEAERRAEGRPAAGDGRRRDLGEARDFEQGERHPESRRPDREERARRGQQEGRDVGVADDALAGRREQRAERERQERERDRGAREAKEDVDGERRPAAAA